MNSNCKTAVRFIQRKQEMHKMVININNHRVYYFEVNDYGRKKNRV